VSGEEAIITVRDLRKSYGAVVAVDGVSFEVRRGEVFGIVGPNGAGKTTTLECLVGLREPDCGVVRVLGLDPRRDARELRSRVGIQLQSAALPEGIRVWEALALFAAFYPRAADCRSLIRRWGLERRRNARFSDLSGGERQRLFVALTLVNDPEVVFLDELSAGLDPEARSASWDAVESLRAAGATVVLVTHAMDEAEALCDRVAIVDRGRIAALDTPAGLIDACAADATARPRLRSGRVSLEDAFARLTRRVHAGWPEEEKR
jgi:ABC-2 type transport system ATP-binding protein